MQSNYKIETNQKIKSKKKIKMSKIKLLKVKTRNGHHPWAKFSCTTTAALHLWISWKKFMIKRKTKKLKSFSMWNSQVKSAKNATTMHTVTPFLEKPNSKGSKRISPTSFTTKFTTKKYSSTNLVHSKDSGNMINPDVKLAKEEFVNFLHFQVEPFNLDSYLSIWIHLNKKKIFNMRYIFWNRFKPFFIKINWYNNEML